METRKMAKNFIYQISTGRNYKRYHLIQILNTLIVLLPLKIKWRHIICNNLNKYMNFWKINIENIVKKKKKIHTKSDFYSLSEVDKICPTNWPTDKVERWDGDEPGFTEYQAQVLVDRHNYHRAKEDATSMIKLVNIGVIAHYLFFFKISLQIIENPKDVEI